MIIKLKHQLLKRCQVTIKGKGPHREMSYEYTVVNPYKVPSGPTSFFDVDDTLLMWDLPEGITDNHEDVITVSCRGMSERVYPNKHNITLLKKFASRGHAVIVWSAGGADWAEAAVIALGLQGYVHVVMGKPNYFIDDIADPNRWMGKHTYIGVNGKRQGHTVEDNKSDEQK